MSIWPSLIFLAINVFGIGVLVKEKEFTLTLFISTLITFILLIWGGFFDPLFRLI